MHMHTMHNSDPYIGCEYCDNIVRNSGAIGEGVSSGSVIVVKTHRTHLHFNNTVSELGHWYNQHR